MIRILMIEDDTHIAKGLQYLLKKEAYDVEIAGTIQEGKERKRLKEEIFICFFWM